MTYEQKQEKIELIKKAAMYLKDGLPISRCKNEEVKKMMSKIAANAVIIKLYNINELVISNISDGDFESVQQCLDDLKSNFVMLINIMRNKGDYIVTQIDESLLDYTVNYTIYEQTEGSEIE